MAMGDRRGAGPLAAACLTVCLPFVGSRGQEADRDVVIYTSLDQRFSEKLLRRFEKERGIRVRAVYDTEAVKTVGLAARLLAERERPRADVYWSSEIVHTIALARRGILAPYRSPSARGIPPAFRDAAGRWTGFAARLRIIIVNRDRVPEAETPRSVFDLTRRRWKGRVAIANPLFGTTATHVAALWVSIGPARTRRFLLDLKANGAAVLAGNAMVKDRVAAGDFDVGLTDTDDAALAVRRGAPVRVVIPDQDGIGALLIPNTVALIRGAPHPREARALIDWILRPETEALLASAPAEQIPVRDAVERPRRVPRIPAIRRMEVDWERAAGALEEAAAFVREAFLE